MSDFKSKGGIGRIANACRYSAQGFAHALRHEAAFRQELLFAIPAIIGVWFLGITPVEKIVLLASVVLVLVVEMLNSAIEAVVDRVSLERHPLAGRAKDLGSAAVMLSLALMVSAWALLAGPAIFALLAG
jgi:diacylglycerol kinase (ATP)